MSDQFSAEELWAHVLTLLEDDPHISEPEKVITQLAHPVLTVDTTFIISVTAPSIKSYIEANLQSTICGKLQLLTGKDFHLLISVDAQAQESHASAHETNPPTPLHTAPTQEAPTQESYSYPHTPENFVPDTFEPETPASPAFSSSHSLPEAEPEWTFDLRNPEYSEDADHFVTPEARAELERKAHAAALNPRYTFENFVVGHSNRFAFATSSAVAEAPGKTYNPLFLYSSSGMGKTHLMHAIGNSALALNPQTRVRYVTAEEFMSSFIYAVREKKQSEFKETYRNVDILLIDDIQFIGKSDTTVEEFFHTFNSLMNANKQVVITSDVPPNLLNGFEERMLSRFNSGVSAGIEPPSLETRIAILEKKAEADHINVPDDVNEFIALNITTSVREMEGALRRVTAYADLQREQVSLALAQVVLKDLISNPDSMEITPSLIIAQACQYFGVTTEQLQSSDRQRTLATARQITMYLCREMTDLSLPRIGEIFGNRDHTTVMHAYRKIDKQLSQKESTYNEVTELTSRIRQAAKNIPHNE